MGEYVLRKKYQNHLGIDLKSSDLTRDPNFSSGSKNVQYRKSGALEKRKGYQAHASSVGGHGLFTYNRADPTTGSQTAEILSVSNTLNKLLKSELTVTYSGSEAVSILSVFYDTSTSQYRCQIQEGTTSVLDKALGLGFDETTTVTIEDLRADINAITDFTATLSGATTTPAAFLKIVREYNLISSAYTEEAAYWTALNSPLSTPFAGSETNKNSLEFENVSAIQVSNVMLMTNGTDEVMKYDGQNVYRAGVPEPATITHASGGAGAITGSNYIHVIQYLQKDDVGNIVEGNILKSDGLNLAAESADVTVANVLAASGFNTNCAIVAGAQVTVNIITVDDGSGGSHTMKVGDTAYFFDSVAGDYIEREVTAIAAGTITVAGAAVTVADNAVVSNNLRISLFRSKTSAVTPTTFFLIGEFPNDSFSATQVINDDLADASLGAQLIESLTDRTPPPKGKYISLFRNTVVIAGSATAPNSVFYSDIDGAEFFPAGVNTFDVETVSGDVITGLASNNELFAVFKARSIFTVSGNIEENAIRVDQVTSDIGCSAHHSIQEVRGTLYFLSDRGPYQMRGGEIPVPIGGNRLEPVFDGTDLTEETKQILFGTQDVGDDEVLRLKRAIAINDRVEELYVLFIPTETANASSDRYANTSSKVFVYDYARDAWIIWDSINAAGGITASDNELFFIERRNSTFTGSPSVDHVFYRRHTLSDSYAYQDNAEAITWEHDGQWEALGEPSILKRFLRIRLFGLEDIPNNSLNLDVTTEINYVRDVTKTSFTIVVSGLGYGVSSYGTAGYGDPAVPTAKNRLLPGRVRAIRVRLGNSNDQENVIVSGWELEAALPYRPAFKS